ncbi:hypothetical protein [Spiroplasma endosymbiont of Eupeodes luniger]|uniref:hypothetical protein n=1 Tax=Spiroplasma endosymbiont of Eupeodes luniger TaxID=3066300 RepID=UPI0030CB203C
MDTALSIHLIKIAIYLIAFLFSSLGTSAILWNSILNSKKPREALLFYFLVTLALTYLVGSLFIAFLGIELWIK